VENFGKAKQRWLQQFLALPNGIPSHDTFGRVFARLNPEQFQACFLRWVQAVFERTEGQVVAIDGKQVRRSGDSYHQQAAIHMVSAWATANHLVLGQRKVDAKSNEITAIPLLLQSLLLEECIVTLDAMGCQKEIAQQIIDAGADYVLACKANQGHFHHDLNHLFYHAHQTQFAEVAHDYHRTIEKDHGRMEIRQGWVISDPLYRRALHDHHKWPQLQSLVQVQAERRLPDKTTRDTRYYITSLAPDAQQILDATRSHWGIENGLHWVLDLAFREDEARTRLHHSAHNFAILRQIALNLLKQEVSAKLGIKAKRLKAGWDESYLLKVLLAPI
jgi:predicted transposase YbfD/YdcC